MRGFAIGLEPKTSGKGTMRRLLCIDASHVSNRRVCGTLRAVRRSACVWSSPNHRPHTPLSCGCRASRQPYFDFVMTVPALNQNGGGRPIQVVRVVERGLKRLRPTAALRSSTVFRTLQAPGNKTSLSGHQLRGPSPQQFLPKV
jgi:hypothetical protein